MTNKEKVYRAKELIRNLGLEDVRRTDDETYQIFANVTLFELAGLITELTNAIYDLRDIMESEG